MKTVVLTMLLFMAMAIPATAQVDTVMLVNSLSIYTADTIAASYPVDLNNDRNCEIVICTKTGVEVHGWPSGILIWQSPNLIKPDSLQFIDINHDGYLDIAIHDSLNILIYDYYNSILLWESPPFGNTYCCYNIGNLNNDNMEDIVIVRKEPFTRRYDTSNLDTIWVDVYNGPTWNLASRQIILVPCYYYGTLQYASCLEIPLNVIIARIPGPTGYEIRILLFTKRSYSAWGHGGLDVTRTSGSLRIIDSDNTGCVSDTSFGKIENYYSRTIAGNPELFTISSYIYSSNPRPPAPSSYIGEYFLCRILADSLPAKDIIWLKDNNNNRGTWNGFTVGNITNTNAGDEICYAAGDTTFLLSFPSLGSVWSARQTGASGQVFGIYNSNQLYSDPQIVYGNLNRLIYGSNGVQSSAFANQGITIKSIADSDSNGVDELITFRTNELSVYQLAVTNPDYPRFIEHIVDTSFNSPTQVVFSDMDRDGDFDILACGGYYASWWETIGSFSFIRHNIDSAFNRTSVCAADIDNDSDIDICSTNRSYNEDNDACWWENDGNQIYTKHVISTFPYYPTCIKAMDINRDGSTEIFICSIGDNTISYWRYENDSTFHESPIANNFSGACYFTLFDFDRDNRPDLIAAGISGNSLSWWRFDGATFSTERPITEACMGAVSVDAGDINNDGIVDIVGAAIYTNEIAWWENYNSTFIKHIVSSSFSEASCVKLADLDNDGNLDIIATAQSGNEIAWWENCGSGNFIKHSIKTGYNGARYIDVVDIDYDGDKDIVACAYSGRQITIWENNFYISIDGDRPTPMPSGPFLSSNYPNPFNNSTVIKYGLTKTGSVRIDIYDILGRKVETIINKVQNPGYYEIRWEADNLPSGIYFYRLQAENRQVCHKMLLLR
jgi:hypothetical protein